MCCILTVETLLERLATHIARWFSLLNGKAIALEAINLGSNPGDIKWKVVAGMQLKWLNALVARQ